MDGAGQGSPIPGTMHGVHPPRIPPQLTCGPFTVADAASYGVTRRMLDGPHWRRLVQGIYVYAELSDSPQLVLQAGGLALQRTRRGFLAGPTAALAYGIDLAEPALWVGHEPERRVGGRHGWVVKAVATDPGDVITWEIGAMLTSPLRTAFDCCHWLGQVEACIVVDALAHAGHFGLGDLERYAQKHAAERGAGRCAAVLAVADARSESPMETRLRIILIDAACARNRSFGSSTGNTGSISRFRKPASRWNTTGRITSGSAGKTTGVATSFVPSAGRSSSCTPPTFSVPADRPN